MTERERIQEVYIQHPETMDELVATTRPMREVVLPDAVPQSVTRTLVVMPVDRVRWAAVLTGLVVALITVALLSLLGLAIGFTTITPGNIAGALEPGTGVWSALSILIALVIGGWAAARTAAVPGRANGALNGALVWVATTLLVFALLGSGVATLAAVASSIVTTGARLAAPLTGQAAANMPDLLSTGSIAAWGMLLALLVGLVAATLGGLLGARSVTDLTTTYVLPHERTTLR
ncbi:MAG: hypothetical protein ACJ8CR_27025 [Roseiflexaceae bacterium]